MSRIALQSLPYSQDQFAELTRIDKLHAHLCYPNHYHLLDEEHQYLVNLRRVFAIMAENLIQRDREMLISRMDNRLEYTPYQVRQMISDTKRLFGDMEETNKIFDRLLIGQKLLNLANKAEIDEDFAEARRNLTAYAKLNDLGNPEIQNNKPKELPKVVVRTSNAAAYTDAQIVEDE